VKVSQFVAKHSVNIGMTFWKHLFTGRDNHTYDLGRVLWATSLFSFIAITLYSLYKGGYDFDPVTWGAGCAALLASGGAALGLKSATEPLEINGAKVTFKRGKTSDDEGDDASEDNSSDEDASK
jgi:hypothetical protein